MTDDDKLLEELTQVAEPPTPKDFRPGVVYSGRMPSEITTGAIEPVETEEEWEAAVRAMGIHIPEGYGLVLVEAILAGSVDPAAWHRDIEDAKANVTHSAYTAPKTTQRWRYRFRVVQKDSRADEDFKAMLEEASRVAASSPAPGPGEKVSKIISLADFQIGKTDELGGTADTLARSEVALSWVVADLEAHPVDEIVLIDAGDSTEGFESAPNAAQGNDLDQTAQIRVWRRILWRWIETLAPLAPSVVVLGVPSNHCRVRRGKAPQGKPNDDWGIETIAMVHDIAAVNEATYGHVRFVVPNEYDEHVLFTLVGGQVLGVAHGHQKNQASQLPHWVKSTGRRGLAQADIVVVGHFHHMEVVAFGDGQWLFVSPTNDNGSSWFTPSSGERSQPGILTFRADGAGWFALDPIWLSPNM